MHTIRRAVPFKAPEPFDRAGITWTREPASERERNLRQAYLNYAKSSGREGLASILLLSLVSQRQGAVAADLADAAAFAEGMLCTLVRKHQENALYFVSLHLEYGLVWQ